MEAEKCFLRAWILDAPNFNETTHTVPLSTKMGPITLLGLHEKPSDFLNNLGQRRIDSFVESVIRKGI
jgi:hypothetical protein